MQKKHQHLHFLTEAKLPAAHLPLHEKRLEKALLHTLEHKKINFLYFLTFFSHMNTAKKFTVISLSTFMLLGMFASFNFLSNATPVNAQTLIADVSKEVKELSQEKASQLEKKFQVNLDDILTQAKTAQDLKYCNKEDCKLFQNISLLPDSKLLKEIKYLDLLEFTDKDGYTVFMAVDEHNIPIYIIRFKHENTSGFTLQFTPGESFPDGTELQFESEMQKE